MFKRVGLTAVVVVLSGLAVSPAAIASDPKAQRPKLTTTLDGKSSLPARVRWLAHPPGKAAAVTEVRFLVDGKLRWIEHSAPFNYGSDDSHGHLGWLTTSWLSAGRHRFTTQAHLLSGQTLIDTVVARVTSAPEPPATLAGRWRRTLTARFVPSGTWDVVFDRVGAWDLDPVGTGTVQHLVIGQDTIHIDAGLFMTPMVNGHTTLARYGRKDIAGFYCREDGPVGTYRWSVSGDQLTLTPIDEPCGLRKEVWAGTWTRVA